jgi:hypothetical protein
LPISAIAEELSIQPTQIHQWVAMGMGLPGCVCVKQINNCVPRHALPRC